MLRTAGLSLAVVSLALAAACTSNDSGPASSAPAAQPTTSAPSNAHILTLPPPVTRTATADPGDRLITQSDLVWKTYGEALPLLGSGSWQPSTYYVKAMVGPESTRQHISETGDQLAPWIVTGVCFTKDYEVGLEITPQADIPNFDPATPPTEGHTASAGRNGRCDNGFLDLNLSKDPRR